MKNNNQKEIEYLDRKEVGNILADIIHNPSLPSIFKSEFLARVDTAIREICQPKPKNQVTKEKVIKILDKQIWHLIKDNNLFIDFWHPANKDLFFGEIANEILEEIK